MTEPSDADEAYNKLWGDRNYDEPLRFHFTEGYNIGYQAGLAAGRAEAKAWRPIESAPRDGTLVDLWGSYGHGDGFRQPGFGWRDRRWINDDGDDASDYPRYIFQPTHWLPIPAPPTAPEDGPL